MTTTNQWLAGQLRCVLMISVRVTKKQPLTCNAKEWRQIFYQVWNDYGEERARGCNERLPSGRLTGELVQGGARVASSGHSSATFLSCIWRKLK